MECAVVSQNADIMCIIYTIIEAASRHAARHGSNEEEDDPVSPQLHSYYHI